MIHVICVFSRDTQDILHSLNIFPLSLFFFLLSKHSHCSIALAGICGNYQDRLRIDRKNARMDDREPTTKGSLIMRN